MIEQVRTPDAAAARCREFSRSGRQIGLVPTMGALHEGHLSLIRRCRKENDCVVVSMFVNPMQFDDPEDFAAYARTQARDLELSADAGADLVFLPDEQDLYPDGYRYRITETCMSHALEGAHRPGHFDGVLTVVLKLLNIVRPARAYFGEKDWQQLQLVGGMASALFLDVEIVACPTVREQDGLAMSSRNARLDGKQRQLALEFPRVLASGKSVAAMIHELEGLGFAVDYVKRQDGRTLGAVRVGKIRLIDNVKG